MKVEDTLLCHSLEELLEMLAKATNQLLVSKTKYDPPEEIEKNQTLVETIQKAIVAKQAELPPQA
jgi:hypothetical protein